MRRIATPLLAAMLVLAAACGENTARQRQIADFNARFPGRCTIQKFGDEAVVGLLTYRLRTYKEVKPGKQNIPAFTLECGSMSKQGDRIMLVIPNLPNTFVTGEYKIIDPDMPPPRPDSISPYRIALAVLQRTPIAPLNYVGRNGSIKILSVAGDTIKGAYLVGFTPADPAVKDSMIVGGGFLAPPPRS